MSVDSLTLEQRPAFERAKKVCYSEIGAPPAPPPIDEEGIRRQYGHLLDTRQCLIDLGFDISEPPSVELFVDTWETGPWHPYDDLPNLGEQEWLDVNEKCPQT